MKTMTLDEIRKSADEANRAWKTCRDEICKMVAAAKHERKRRERAGVELRSCDYVIGALSGLRDQLGAMPLNGAWNGIGADIIVGQMLDEGWEK